VNKYSVESELGKGAQHNVGRIGNKKLIKYPHLWGRLWDKSNADTVRNDLDLHKEWNLPIPEAFVIANPIIDTGKKIVRPPYAIIIEEVAGRVFREVDLDNPTIKDHVTDITERSLKLRSKKNKAVDFLGGEAFGQFLNFIFCEKRPGMLGAYNLIINTREQVVLIDTNLLDPSRAPFGRTGLIDRLIDMQHGLLTELLKEPTLIESCRTGNKSVFITKLASFMYRYSRKIEAKRKS